MTGSKNAAATGVGVAVDAFIVGATTTQESAGKIAYDAWTGGSAVNASAGAYRTTTVANSTSTFTFTGTRVDWVTAMGPGSGKARVYIDGIDKGIVDLYASAQQWQRLKSYAGLSSGTHKIQIKALGTKNAAATGTKVLVDGFAVYA